MIELPSDLAAWHAGWWNGRRHRLPRHGRRLLYVDDLVPDPVFGAGYPRAYEVLQTMVASHYEVDHYAMEGTPTDRSRVATMFEGKVHFHPAQGMRGLRRLLWRQGADFDVIFISRPRPMRTFLGLRWRPAGSRQRPAVIYDAEAVLAPREKRRRDLYGAKWSDLEYQEAIQAELSVAAEAAAVTTVGPGDAAVVRSRLDVPVFVLPHSEINRTGAPDSSARQDVLFVGRLVGHAFESPNVDSVLWFVAEVMPLLDRLIGRAYRLHLVGWLDSHEVAALESERIVVHGAVEDLRSLYDRCRLFVAPTRFAAGIPGKVTEAMSEGIPCVVTTLLAEQLEASDQELAIAGDAPSFAQACARLYTDADAWNALRDGGFAYVARACSPEAFKQRLLEVLHCVTDRPLPRPK